MPLNPLTVSPPSSPQPRSRSILSRFTNRFGAGNRNVSEFYVQPSDPWKTYFPGETVEGTVVLKVVRPIRITHLVVCLHGYAKVFKNAVAPGEPYEESGFLSTGRGRRGGEYLGGGFATLFEDEIVLCGEGRLKEGIYKFKFELEFPPYGLPSSISFERGTISYMITSTLTRPTSISPTMTCDRKIVLLDNIDLAPLSAPKPRIITLEPIQKRSRARSKHKNSSAEQCDGGATSPSPSVRGSLAVDPPLSPSPSEQSSSSYVSNSTQSFQVVGDRSSTNGASMKNSECHSYTTASSDRTITATTELLRAGGLPGDNIPLKISISHTKPVRAPHGIIVTLYRQGRIDFHPDLPIGPREKGKKLVYEDYYPKSLTGLKGLTFSTTKSNGVFRKDLSQTFAPLIIDPSSMMAVVKTSVRIPEDCFPTITKVPGGMITFRYYVEVVIDLRGKLAAQERLIPRLNMMTATDNYSPGGQAPHPMDKGGNQITSAWAGNILDTDRIRREKSVVACVFEAIVGSKDSSRGQAKLTDGSNSTDEPPRTAQTAHPNHGFENMDQNPHQQNEDWEHGPYEEYEYDPHAPWPNGFAEEQPPPSVPPMHLVPPPEPEEEVDEKTRLQRAEALLLPSQPPGQAEPGPVPDASAPSAPDIPEDRGIYPYAYAGPSAPPLISAGSMETIQAGPSSVAGPSNAPWSPQLLAPPDDKQELERRRLMMEASAPEPSYPDQPHVDEDRLATATAPVLNEEEEYSHITGETDRGESLPQYQR